MKVWLFGMFVLSCASEAQAPVHPPEPHAAAHAEPPGAPVVHESNAPPALALDAPAVSLSVPIPPGFELTVAEHGEYRIDVVARGDADPALHLYRGEDLVVHDDDGGDGANARAVVFLEPATYSIRITERAARPLEVDVHAERLPPLDPVLALPLARPTYITFPELPQLLRRPENDRDAARAMSLTIERRGRYRCVTRMDNGRFVRAALVLDGRVVAADEQRLTDNNATITAELAPGTYELRLSDVERRGDMRATTTCEEVAE